MSFDIPDELYARLSDIKERYAFPTMTALCIAMLGASANYFQRATVDGEGVNAWTGTHNEK